MKKTIKHAIAIALLVSFAVLALGSMGSSPSSGSSSGGGSSGGSSSNRCPESYTCRSYADDKGNTYFNVCGRSNSCRVYNADFPPRPNTNVTCDCPR